MLMCVCQGLKAEIAQWQLTIGCVNERQSSSETMADRADFAERLGDVNRRYQAVASDVSERLKHLNLLQLQWTDYEAEVSSLTAWLAEQHDRLASIVHLQHHATVQQAVRECHVCLLHSV